MRIWALKWYWDAIKADAHQRQVFIAHIRTNQKVIPDQYTQYNWHEIVRKRRNAALKRFAILNQDKPVRHVTQAKITEKLVETFSEVTDRNMEMPAKEGYSVHNNN